MRQVVLDTETTGLKTEDGHRIIEIGCIEIVNRKFTGQRFHQYINPERLIESGAMTVHGITDQFLQDKPIFADVVCKFVEFINGAELIIHNAPFDVGFIHHELKLTGQTWQPLADICRIVDTLALARKLHVGQRNSLDALCKRYGVDNSQRELHGALLDAHLLAQVYLSMTGGQGSLFDGLQTSDAVTAQKTLNSLPLRASGRSLLVLKPSEEELTLHMQQLQKISEKTKCLWLG